jgi:nucleoid DNA-binding protein
MRQSQIVPIVRDTLRSEGRETGLTVVHEIVSTFLATVAQVLRDGRSVNLRGFGTFYPHHFAGREKPKVMAPRIQPKFRAGDTLKRTVNR